MQECRFEFTLVVATTVSFFQIIDSFIGGTLDLVAFQNIREPKQRRFLATHVNRK